MFCLYTDCGKWVLVAWNIEELVGRIRSALNNTWLKLPNGFLLLLEEHLLYNGLQGPAFPNSALAFSSFTTLCCSGHFLLLGHKKLGSTTTAPCTCYSHCLDGVCPCAASFLSFPSLHRFNHLLPRSNITFFSHLHPSVCFISLINM